MQCGLAAPQTMANDVAVPTSAPQVPTPKFRENDLPSHPALLPDSLPALCAQVLQLKWQMFYVQKSQQELATAILQLSSLILASSSSQGVLRGPLASGTPVSTPGALLDCSRSGKTAKRKWSGRIDEVGQEKMARLPHSGHVKLPRGPLPHILTKTVPPSDCSCETCLTAQHFPDSDRSKQPDVIWQPLNPPMKLKWDCPLPPSLPFPCPPRLPTVTAAVTTSERKTLEETQTTTTAACPAWLGPSFGKNILPPDFTSLSSLPPLPPTAANTLSQQTPADLYVSYLLGSLDPSRMGECGDSVQPLPPVQQQEKPINLAIRARVDVSEPAGLPANLHDSFSDGDVPRLHSIFGQHTVATASEGGLATPADSFEFSPRSSSHSCVFRPTKTLKRRHADSHPGGKFCDDSSSAVEDLLNFEFTEPGEDEADGGAAEPCSGSVIGGSGELTNWTPDVLGDKDKAIVVLNPAESREMFVGGDSSVRLPVWAYKKCIYMVGREQKRPAARLCLCLLQSLFSLRYLVSHNYSGSRQKRPIEPTVMKAVIKQSLMQFGARSSFGDHFAQGKLRDYLNNAFRVMAFRRRRGDRVKSPFWNEAGEPILTLDPPKDFRLNGLIITKVLPVR